MSPDGGVRACTPVDERPDTPPSDLSRDLRACLGVGQPGGLVPLQTLGGAGQVALHIALGPMHVVPENV